MNAERFRAACLSLPGTTETLQWGDDLVFKIGGKMFAVYVLGGDGPGRFSFKCSEERFHELTELPGIVPAPYLARAHWVHIDPRECRLGPKEIEPLLREAYAIVAAKLPQKTRTLLKAKRKATF